MTTTNILFTADSFADDADNMVLKIGDKTITVDEIRPSLGEAAFQLDAIVRRSDGAFTIQASIPRFTMHEGRVLNAYGSIVVDNIPPGLEEYAGAYKGRIRPILSRNGQPILDAEGRPVKGHLWETEDGRQFSALQIHRGQALCMVNAPQPSQNGWTVKFNFLLSKNIQFGPWSRPIRRPVSQIEEVMVDIELSNKTNKKETKAKFEF